MLLRSMIAVLLLSLPLAAADWLTFGGDPQRSGWARDEETLNAQSVKGLKLEWKIKADNTAKEMYSLTVPVVVNPVITPRGFKELAFVAGASDVLYAIDTDSGKLFWQKKFTINGEGKQKPNWLCPVALNATPVIDKQSRTVYVLTSDGYLHSLNVVNGEDRQPPKAFVPPFSKPYSLNLSRGVLYAATAQGCGGAKNGVFAMDLNDPERPVAEFRSTTTGGAGIWGRAGVAIGFDGRIYVETGDGPYDPRAGKWADTFLSLKPKTLELADYYTPANRAWITKKDLDMGCISPVVFQFKKWELIAGAGKEGVLYVLDAKSPGGQDHRTPLYRSELITNEDVDFAGRGFWGSISTWEDPGGARWLYLPAYGPPASTAPKFEQTYGETPNGSIMAFKIEEKDGKPAPAAVWNSVDMKMPEPVVIANGVVFALSNGEYVR
ncbi:MAG: pyrrolo-quinoline quinone, partial [Acidobacteria bacterium]|nr:pyrrolo-quinoline quinone [Acidobacteriota bacterium]